MSDAALRDVVDMIDRDQLTIAVPAEWSRKPAPTLRDILAAHTFDESWVPDLLAGHTVEQVGTKFDGDLLGDDPIASYDEANDAATEAVLRDDLDPERVIHFTYGEYPLAEGLTHISTYRAFQAWQIAKLLGLDFELPEPLVDALWELVVPHAEEWRGWGVFPPEVQVPADADSQTRLLAKVGYWKP